MWEPLQLRLIEKLQRFFACRFVGFPGTSFWAKSITKVSTTINTTNIKKYSNQIRHFSHQWKWFYERDSLDAFDLAETTEELYVIPDIPSHPWNTNAQQYSLYEPNYIWTSLLDICCKACEEYNSISEKNMYKVWM